MKIFISFLQGNPNHPIPAYSFWEYYIKSGIEEAGHTWVECPLIDWAYGLVPQSKENLDKWKDEAWEKTVAFLKKNSVDLFLSYLYPNQIDVQAVKQIQGLNIPCVNFFCDNIREFQDIPKEFSVFDLNWVPEFKALAMYKKADFAYIHLPMPMWVAPEHRKNNVLENSAISFIGSADIQRQMFFEDLLKMNPNLDLAIYGSGWGNVNTLNDTPRLPNEHSKLRLNTQIDFIKKQGIIAFLRKTQQRNFNIPYSETLKSHLKGRPSHTDYITITQHSMITLGINRYPSYRFPINKPDSYSRLRDIEAPMLGACYLTEWTDGLDQMYDIGKEILTYKTVDDLNEIIFGLQFNKIKRKEVRLKGQKKALAELSISKSLEKLFTQLK